MSNALKITVTIFFIINFAGCSFFSRRYTKNYSGETRVMAKGKTGFKLDNSNGRIKVSHTDEPFIIIKYDIQNKVKKQEYEDASKGYSLTIDSTGNIVKVEAEEPEEHGFVFEHSFRANYEIFLPDGIEANIDNINGNVIFNQMGNDIKADVQNGSGAGLEGSEVPCKRRGKGWHAEVVVMEECHCTSCISRQECPAQQRISMTATLVYCECWCCSCWI